MTRRFTPKQQKFVSEYLIDMNATKAAERAGYSSATATRQGYELLNYPHVAAAVRAHQEQLQQISMRTAADILEDLATIRRVSMATYTDPTTGLPTMVSSRDALKALEMEAKRLGLFSDKIEITGKNGSPIIQRIERVILDK